MRLSIKKQLRQIGISFAQHVIIFLTMVVIVAIILGIAALIPKILM